MNQQKVSEQIMLLLTDSDSWSDEQITALLANQEEIGHTLYRLYRSFPHHVEQVQRYRAKKKELSVLPTEELLKREQAISKRRAAIIEEDYADELPDSFYESPPIDSDEHIIYEILKERKVVH